MSDATRRDELAARLGAVEDRIGRACRAAGRERDEVTLVAVTKFFPAADVRLLHDLGVRAVAESRHQEAVAKVAECAGLDLAWHFVGQLQSNKAAAVGAWADCVQSVDRASLVTGLAKAAADRDRPVDVCVQVSLDPPGAQGGRSGVAGEGLEDLLQRILAADGLLLRGVMAIAPREGDPHAAFARLRELAAVVRSARAEATWVSAGMSGDLEAAVEHGATHVRVGSAILGNRPPRG